MKIFPTQYSTLSSVALKKHIHTKYGFKILTCNFLLRGVNDHYLIETDDSKYIFRIYRNTHRSLHEISAELALLKILKEHISVSYPINMLNNDKIVTFNAAEGTRYGVLFSYANGVSISQLNDIQLSNLGRDIGKIHNITSNVILPFERKEYNVETTMRQPLLKFQPVFKENPLAYKWLTETSGKVIEKLKSFNVSSFSYGYCHYDLLPKNFHFDINNQITFFDFDFAGKGYLVNDIMIFWIHLNLNALYKRTSQEEADRSFDLFIASYREVRSLSDEEISAIPYLSFNFWIFFMGFHYEHFDDFSNTFFNARFANERFELIKTLTDKFCVF